MVNIGVWKLLFLVLELCIFARFVKGSCPKLCSGHGTCDKYYRCTCNSGYQGADCSERVCPFGNAWNDMAYATDLAHASAECSNRGLCNRGTGLCACMEGFGGSACERMTCSLNCNGNGKCYSMNKLAAQTRDESSNSYTYETEHASVGVWDANKIYGCKCDPLYDGYDCSLRSCATGDDPLTTGQVNEVQLVECIATTGNFYLYYKGYPSLIIPFDASAETVRTALLDIPLLTDVTVTYSVSGAVACQILSNVISIEFKEQFGSLSPLVAVMDSTMSTSGSLTVAADGITSLTDYLGVSIESVKGTKEDDLCAGRGLCIVADGTCSCFDANGDTYASSDGYGNAGDRGDCGFISSGSTVSSCPGATACSGNGVCDESTYTCSCNKGWEGGDCSLRSCPTGKSWFNYPSEDNKAHFDYASCSNMGICDLATGLCTCRENFYGQACEFMGCGGGLTTPCNNNGKCVTMKEMALWAENNGDATSYTYGQDPNEARTWDAERIHGCICDPGHTGYDCSLKTCPTGDDPATFDDHVEVQLMTCNADSGSFTLTFRQQTTGLLYANSTADDIRDALMELSSFSAGGVTWQSSTARSDSPVQRNRLVENGNHQATAGGEIHYPVRVYFHLDDGSIPYGIFEDVAPLKPHPMGDPQWEAINSTERNATTSFCNTAGTQVAVISFDAVHGDVPSLTADASGLTYTSGVTEYAGSISVFADGAATLGFSSITGTTEDVECNNRGLCNRQNGRCVCSTGYSSSDGQGRSGYIGDCGAVFEGNHFRHSWDARYFNGRAPNNAMQ